MKLNTVRAGLSARSHAFEAIRARVVSGQWQEGSEIPSERELAKDLGVARMTLRSALDQLTELGVIETGQGKKRRVSRTRSMLLAQTVGIVSARRIGSHERFFVPSQEYFTQLSAEAAIQEAGYHILVVHPEMLQGAPLQQFLDNRPAGLIWTCTPAEIHSSRAVLESEESRGIPVAVNSDHSAFSGVDQVVHDHKSGGADVARWLIGAGCRHIAAVSTLDHPFDWWQRRKQGAGESILEAGLPPLREVVCKVDQRSDWDVLSPEFFQRRVRQMVGFLVELFQGPTPVDGIIAINDPDAIQIAVACRFLGREPGRDVRIAGYDNLWRYCQEFNFEPSIPCVTMDKNNAAIGKKLAEVLLKRIANPDVPRPAERFIVPHRLICGTNEPKPRFPALC